MKDEIEAAEHGKLPKLVELADIRGDLQMHTVASDGKNSIEEMAEAAQALGYEYIGLTDHSKAVTVANGMDEKRRLNRSRKYRDLSALSLISACSQVSKSTFGRMARLTWITMCSRSSMWWWRRCTHT